jgi:transposase-like protein
MDPHGVFCPNSACPATGQIGEGNINIHSRSPERYRCNVCQKTFSARKGTPLYRRRTPQATIALVLTLVAYGCPIVAAIEAAFGFQRRTVQQWVDAAGEHCEQIHEHLLLKPRDLAHVQADELRVKTQGSIVWMAMALMVSTRLWLGGAISTSRDQSADPAVGGFGSGVRLAGASVVGGHRWSYHLRESLRQGVSLEAL